MLPADRQEVLQIGFVPFDGLVQASLKIIFRVVAQNAFRPGDIGVGVLDVALPVGAEMGLDVLAERLGERMVDVDEVLPPAIGDIKDIPGRFVRSEASFEVRLDHILNVGEVPALLAVAVDRRTLIVQQHLDELGNHSRIGPVRILTAAEHIEIPQPVGIQPIMPRILLGPFLIAPLGQSVGAQQVPFHPLPFRKMLLVPIDRTRRGIDELPDPVPPGRFQHMEGALDIVGTIEKGHLDTPGHAPPRGLMQDIIDPLARFHASVKILDVPLDERIIRVPEEQIDIRLLTRTEVVQAPDPVPHPEDRLAKVGPDEPRPARDEEKGSGRKD